MTFKIPQALDKNPQQRRNGIPKTRAKGVPQAFGYIKRTNGSSAANELHTNAMMNGNGRTAHNNAITAHVSAVPRSNKIKVSGGTQTPNGEFQQSKRNWMRKLRLVSTFFLLEANVQYKSYSLTGQNAAQLSQSVKERFGMGTNSLPKSGVDMHAFHARLAQSFSSPFFLNNDFFRLFRRN